MVIDLPKNGWLICACNATDTRTFSRADQILVAFVEIHEYSTGANQLPSDQVRSMATANRVSRIADSGPL